MRQNKWLTILLFAFAVTLLGAGRGAQSGQERAQDAGGAPATITLPPQEAPAVTLPAQEAAPAPAPITLPVGTTISVRIADAVDSNHNHPGDLITGTVDPSVFIANHVVIPRGTEAHMRMMEDKKGGHLAGKAAVNLELVGLVINDEKLDVDSDGYRKKQGALSAKLKGTGTASANAGASAATSPNPAGGAVGPIIAVFRAAKVQMPAGTRIPFKLETPFTFDTPVDPPAQ